MADTLITVGELAKLLDLTPQRVCQLVNEGVLPKASRGSYEMRACVNAYINFLREKNMTASGSQHDYRTEKARLTKAQADLAELELAKSNGEVASVEEFEKATSAVMTMVKINMLNVPQRIVTRLLGETDETKFKDVLQDEIRQALETIAGSELEMDEEE